MIKQEQFVVGLDIGTTKIAVMVGRRNEFGKLEILGMGKTESVGVMRGQVVNIERTVQSIKTAVEEAEAKTGVKISRVNVGIAGQHIKSIQHHGIRTRSEGDTEITQVDIDALIEDMYKLAMLPGEEIIHVIPQEYLVDNEAGIKEPIGMCGRRLEANFHIITGQITAINNLIKCVRKANLEVMELTLEPLASADAVLSHEEKEAGVVLVDIGGGTTDIAIFQDSIIRHTAVIPFGGNIITEDIKEGCTIIKGQAELLKIKFGSALASQNQDNEIVSIPGLRGREPKEISLKNLAHIIEARMEEIIEHVYYEIKSSGFEKKLIAGIVVTGGGSCLKHLTQLTEYITGMDTRIGFPNEHIGKGNEEVASPIYATSVGLVLRGLAILEKEKPLTKEVVSESGPIAEPEKQTVSTHSKKTKGNFFEKLLEKATQFLSEDNWTPKLSIMENLNLMNFELPRDTNSIIKVVGVGGGGCNAVDHMYRMGIKGVDFIVCNTDQQALDKSPVPVKIPLGITLTEGLGAGSIPEVGKNSAIESIEQIREVLSRKTKMVFITCGMGGGTGTGAAPVIAAAAREMGILTVAIVTIPFSFEGKKRKMQAEHGIEELKKSVDTLLIISNDKLREIYGDLKMTEAFGRADGILTTAAKGIADIITTTLHINTDFADIETVLKDSGVAIMGSASAEGESRALKAVELALASPLLSDSNIRGARHVLLNITCGEGVNEITMDEFGEITDYLQDVAGMSAEVIQGYGIDPTLDNSIKVTIIATGFQNKSDAGVEPMIRKPERKIHQLNEPVAEQKIESPTIEQNIEPVMVSSVVVSEQIISVEIETEESDLFSMNNVVNDSSELNVISSFQEPSERIVHQLHSETEDPEQIVASSSIEFTPVAKTEQNLSEEESQRKLSQERLDRIKRFNFKRNFAEMESKPAYQRKSIVLNNVPPANESNVSRFTLGEGDDQKGEIRGNNSFLHDSVD